MSASEANVCKLLKGLVTLINLTRDGLASMGKESNKVSGIYQVINIAMVWSEKFTDYRTDRRLRPEP